MTPQAERVDEMRAELAHVAEVRSTIPTVKQLAAKYHRTPRRIQELLKRELLKRRAALRAAERARRSGARSSVHVTLITWTGAFARLSAAVGFLFFGPSAWGQLVLG